MRRSLRFARLRIERFERHHRAALLGSLGLHLLAFMLFTWQPFVPPPPEPMEIEVTLTEPEPPVRPVMRQKAKPRPDQAPRVRLAKVKQAKPKPTRAEPRPEQDMQADIRTERAPAAHAGKAQSPRSAAGAGTRASVVDSTRAAVSVTGSAATGDVSDAVAVSLPTLNQIGARPVEEAPSVLAQGRLATGRADSAWRPDSGGPARSATVVSGVPPQPGDERRAGPVLLSGNLPMPSAEPESRHASMPGATLAATSAAARAAAEGRSVPRAQHMAGAEAPALGSRAAEGVMRAAQPASPGHAGAREPGAVVALMPSGGTNAGRMPAAPPGSVPQRAAVVSMPAAAQQVGRGAPQAPGTQAFGVVPVPLAAASPSSLPLSARSEPGRGMARDGDAAGLTDNLVALSGVGVVAGRTATESGGTLSATRGSGSSRVDTGRSAGSELDARAGTQAAPGRAIQESAAGADRQSSAPRESREVHEKFSARVNEVKAPTSICQLPAIAAGMGGTMEGLDNLSAQGMLPGEKPPRLHPRSPRPVYPIEAIARQEQGQVLLRAEVLDSGAIRNVLVKQSSGSRVLDRAALDAVTRWRFKPAERDGKAITAWVDVPVDFRNPSLYKSPPYNAAR